MSIEKRAPSFPWSISLGNVLQIVLMIVTITGAVYTVSLRSTSNAQELSEVVADIEDAAADRDAVRAEMHRSIDAVESRIRVLETQWARADERLGNMLSLLSRIDDRLERIESDVRTTPTR